MRPVTVTNLNSLNFDDANNDGTEDDAYDTDLDTTNGNWTPIGSATLGGRFTATFAGNGYTISNMSVAITSIGGNAGLFGSTGVGAVIRNVGLIGVSVQGGSANNNNAGGLVGINDNATIIGSYVTGSVVGDGGAAGGLVGLNTLGTIIGSYATGSVSGNDRIGGLVGQNDNGTISNSYATGSVTGSSEVGGLVGRSVGGAISNSYAIGVVTGIGINVGGLVGSGFGDVTVNSYWNTDTSGQAMSAVGEGRSTRQLVTPTTASVGSTYVTWSTDVWDFGTRLQYAGLRLPLSTDDCTVGAGTPLCTHRPADPDVPVASISAADPTTITEGEVATFTVALDRRCTCGRANDQCWCDPEWQLYSRFGTGRTVVIAEGATTGTLTVSTADDNLDESDGIITAVINAGAGYTVGTPSTAMVTVNDDDVLLASISAADPTTITEGDRCDLHGDPGQGGTCGRANDQCCCDRERQLYSGFGTDDGGHC